MRTHFISRLALLLTAGFLVVASQVWTGGTLQWLFVAGGIVMILVAEADAIRGRLGQRALDGLIALLGAWTIVQALVYDGTSVKWISFACAAALALLSAIGLAAHEYTTERVVHELSVKTPHDRTRVAA
jgi:hypothetical protein